MRSVRTISKKANPTPWLQTFLEFPKDKDGIIYVRQSRLTQVQNNIHSFEMQTDKFVEHFRNMGCTGKITIIPDDEGMSGSLDMHERPGMSKTMLAIAEHKKGLNNLGWVAAVHVNRFFRDQWMINPDVFIKECYESDIVVATLRMNYNFRDPYSYSQRIFRIEAEEAARHLEWMKLVLGGGKSAASDKGYYDGRPLPWGYLVDRSDLRQKKYYVYRPHAEIVFWLFKRFFELDGNFPALKREVEQLSYLFPPFEPGVDTTGLRRAKRRRVAPPTLGFTPSEDGLKGILTNPVYIGWWLPIEGGVIENNHEAIVDDWLFFYAHKHISTYDLNGERQRPAINRNGNTEAILKKVTRTATDLPVYACNEGRNNASMYHFAEYSMLNKRHVFYLPVALIDSAFLEKFIERLKGWEGCEDWEDKIEHLRAQRERKKQTIHNLIAEAQRRWQEAMATLKDPNIPKTTQMKIDLANECAGLENKIAKLQQDVLATDTNQEEEELVQYEIYTLLPDIIENWPQLPYEQKLRIVGAFVRRVVLDRPTPGWAMQQIEWKRTNWDVDIAYRRLESHGGDWSTEEEERLTECYPTLSATELVQAFPTRTYNALKQKASRLNVTRKKGECESSGYKQFRTVCFQDVEFAKEQGLVLHDKNPQWRSQPRPYLRYARTHQP